MRVDRSSAGKDDKPMLLADASPQTLHPGRVHLAWTRRDTQGVVVAHSDDQGRTWSAPLRVGVGWGAHLALGRDGTVYLAWWGSLGTLEITRSSDGGEHFHRPLTFHSLSRYPGFGVGAVAAMRTQPVHPDPSLAVDATTGPYANRIYAAYSVPSTRGRLVVVTALSSSLRTVSSRIVAPPRGKSRDAFNATVTVDQTDHTVWLCFYLTGSRARRKLATYSCTVSRDGGHRWSRPRAVASVLSDEAQRGGFTTAAGIDSNYASYEGVAAHAGIAYPAWTDTRRLKRLREEIFTSRVRVDVMRRLRVSGSTGSSGSAAR